MFRRIIRTEIKDQILEIRSSTLTSGDLTDREIKNKESLWAHISSHTLENFVTNKDRHDVQPSGEVERSARIV